MHFYAGNSYGVEFDESEDKTKAKKYIVAMFQNLLHQREKLDKGLLVEHIKPKVMKMWQEVLSTLEETNRKLIDIQSGSLIFTLFSPTRNSIRQLQNESWRTALQKKIIELLRLIGKFCMGGLYFDSVVTGRSKVEFHHKSNRQLHCTICLGFIGNIQGKFINLS